MALSEKVLKELIESQKEYILSLKMDMHDPIQQLFGTAHILISIREEKSRLNELKIELKELI